MIFYVSFTNQSSQLPLIINASSWSSCLAYCEGTGNPLQSIQYLPNAVANNNVTGITNCYQVLVRNAQAEQVNHYVWETDFNSLTTWIESQQFSQVLTIQNSNKSYVVV